MTRVCILVVWIFSACVQTPSCSTTDSEKLPACYKDDSNGLSLFFNRSNGDDLDHLNWLFLGLNALENSFLGGSGSRGYGRVKIEGLHVWAVPPRYYATCDRSLFREITEISTTPEGMVRDMDVLKSRVREALGESEDDSDEETDTDAETVQAEVVEGNQSEDADV